MDFEEKAKIWKENANRNVGDAKDFFKIKHYDWSLFVWSLALEKIIKARIVELQKEVPLIHNLITLCKVAEIELTEAEKMELSEVNTYNIEARYEEIKSALYKKATKEYAEKWVRICEDYYNKFDQ